MNRRAGMFCVAALALVSCGEGTDADQTVATGVAECVPELAVSDHELAVKEVARIGARDEADPGDIAFGEINDLAVSEQGDIVVLDAIAKQIVTLSSTGSVVSRRGRAGSGPGEFEVPWKVHVSPAGQIAIFDARLWRLTTFDADAGVTTERLPPDVGMGQSAVADFDAEGALYNLSFAPYQETLLARATSGDGRVRGDVIIRRWDSAASEWRDLMTVLGPETYYEPGSGLGNPPFPHRPVFAGAESGFWYGDSDSEQFTLFDQDANPRCSIRLPFERFQVSEEERREYYTAEGITEGRKEAIRSARASMPMPEYKATMVFAFGSMDGNVWVDIPEEQGTRWWYFDLTQGVAYPVQVPEPLSPVFADASRLYGIYRDDLGVAYVGVYEIDFP